MTTTDEKIAAIDRAVDMFAPEAQEFLASLRRKIPTTKDNYGDVMAMLSRLPGEGGPLFLIALVRNGYPKATGLQLSDLMGYPAVVRSFVEVETGGGPLTDPALDTLMEDEEE